MATPPRPPRYALALAAALGGLLAVTVAAADKPLPAARDAGYLQTYPATRPVPLDPRLRAALDAAAGAVPIEKQTPAQARKATEERVARITRLNEPVARVDNRRVPGPAGQVPVRVYTPEGREPFPVLLYLHGGGWTLGSLDTHDDICRSLCHRASCVVVSVGYRLAPETKFPGPLEDCYAALQWCAAHAGEVRGDGKRLAMAGDSAGGHLSASLALYARDHKGPRLELQVLIYPATNYGFDTASYHENAKGYGVTRQRMVYYWNNYLRTPEDAANPYVSPLRAKNLAGLPPALILTAAYDPLRDDGEAYAARLHHAGVPVRCVRYLDMNHGFLHFGADYSQARHGLDTIAAALRKALERR